MVFSIYIYGIYPNTLTLLMCFVCVESKMFSIEGRKERNTHGILGMAGWTRKFISPNSL